MKLSLSGRVQEAVLAYETGLIRPAHAGVVTRIGMTIAGIAGAQDDGPGFSRAMAAVRS